MNELKAYQVWDVPTRLTHWVSALCVLGLMGSGLVILNASDLGVSNDGKIALKSIHVIIGYVLAASLFLRLLWACVGNPHARWRAILPGGRGYLRELGDYVRAFRSAAPRHYLGHNPAGRLAVAALLLLMLIQTLSGLILAGTDLFWPPLGAWIAQSIAAPGIDPAALQPYAKATYDAAAYDSMRALRKPVITTHLYTFYVLLGAVVIHVAAVVATELREGGSLISAMITGRKSFETRPRDLPAGSTDTE